MQDNVFIPLQDEPVEIFYTDDNYNFLAKEFLRDYPEDRLHYSASLLKFYDPHFPKYLITKGILKEEAAPGNFFYYYASDLLRQDVTNHHTLPRFSFYKAPVTNKIPYKAVTIVDVSKTITGPFLKRPTEQYRAIEGKDQADLFKRSNFPYCTWSGLFENGRSSETLVSHSNYLCLDFDKLNEPERIREILIKDEQIEPALIFISPSGKGLKVVIQIDTSLHTHLEYFDGCKNYYKATYGIEADKSGKDIPRACFLCYDPACYINPKLLQA